MRYGGSGRPTVVRTPSATIVHSPGGGRVAVVAKPGGRVIVTNSRGHGYSQRPITVRGGSFVQRTYIVGGRPYARFYRPVNYGGVAYVVYAPTRFYSPRFYAWAAAPWGSPVAFSFGWGPATPWFGFYTGYFAPYPSYIGPNFWVTDYLMANSLDAAYQDRADAAAAGGLAAYDPSGQAAVSPEVKSLIAREVSSQIAQEHLDSMTQNVAPAADAAPPVFDGQPHVLVASAPLAASASGQDCTLTGGDVVQLNPGASSDPASSVVKVLASKGQDCAAGQDVAISAADLQEMQNHMRETIDQGLGDLVSKQGQGNLPAIDPAIRATTSASYAADLPAPEAGAETELRQNAQQAVAQEDQLLQQAGPGPTPPGEPPTVVEGQSIEDVVTMMGQPDRRAKVGTKDIYFYKDMKITFVNGKVTDIQ